MDTLEVSKRSLGFLKGNAMDAINKYIEIQNAKLKAATVKCNVVKKAYETSLKVKEIQQNTCFKLLKVIAGVSSPVYNICLGFYYAKIIATYTAQQTLSACETASKVADFLSDVQKFTLWAVHYTLKLA